MFILRSQSGTPLQNSQNNHVHTSVNLKTSKLLGKKIIYFLKNKIVL